MPKLLVANYSAAPFRGWLRTTTDHYGLPTPSGELTNGSFCVVGPKAGFDTRLIDVYCAGVQAGEVTVFDVTQAPEGGFQLGPLPDDPMAFIGGVATCNGQPMRLVSAFPSGAAYDIHLQADVGLLTVDVWFPWYPDQPAWTLGEAMVTFSRPGVPEVVTATPPEGISIAIGNGIVVARGRGLGPIVAGNVQFGDGQARPVPITIVWPQHLKDGVDMPSIVAAHQLQVHAQGVARLGLFGNPRLPDSFNPRHWVVTHLNRQMQALHSWGIGTLGANARPADTGRQEDQWFRGGECFGGGGEPMASLVNYLAALKWGHRPSCFLEADGSVFEPEGKAQPCMMWNSQIHLPHSAENRGKSRAPSAAECGGLHGLDVEHNLMNRLLTAARMNASPALQKIVECYLAVYLCQSTTQTSSGYYTTAPYAARAQGYEAMNAVGMFLVLWNRDKAVRCRLHWKNRLETVLRPSWDAQRANWPMFPVSDVRVSDPRLAPGPQEMPWQKALQAYGLFLAGHAFGIEVARKRAEAFARDVVDRAYYQDAYGRWTCYTLIDATRPVGSHPDSIFDRFAMPMAVWVTLQADPTHAKARAIWEQLLASNLTADDCASIPPGDV